jgi:hypothetical protein
VGALDWAEHFILENKSALERQWREATVSLCLARLAYTRRDLRRALLHLQCSGYKGHIKNLTAKALQLKIYYETSEFGLLESHLASLKNYIRRHTAIGYHRTNYGRMVHYTQQLMGLNFESAKAVAALRERLEGEKILTEKEWLWEMLGGE